MEQRDSQRRNVRFLVFSASLRTDSLNARLADLAAACLEAHGGAVDRAMMRDFDCPSYDFDVQTDDGFPSEEIEFNYGKIKWTYTQQKRADGTGGGNVAGGWDLIGNKVNA